MGHRLRLHESKCRHLHGHTYRGLFTARPEGGLDAVGRVVDFGVLKARIGGWVEDRWDHGFVLEEGDPLIRLWRDDPDAGGLLNGHKLYELDRPPTAECLAEHLLRVVGPEVLDGTGVALVRVVLWETPNCFATAEL